MSSEDRTLVAVKRIIRPLIRLLISKGIRLPHLVAALKQVYVAVAEKDFRLDDKSPTDSRVSVLTGVHRQDVGSIRRDGAPSSVPSTMSLGAKIVGRWLGDPAFTDAEGRAKKLFRSINQGSPSFEDLAFRCSRDVHPRTILDELVSQNLIEWDEGEDVVVLTDRAYVPTEINDEFIHFFEMNLHDHLAAAVHNITEDDSRARFLERAVYYNSLLPRSVKELDSLARGRANEILNELNSEAVRQQDIDRKVKGETTKRFRFGVFFYCEDDDMLDGEK